MREILFRAKNIKTGEWVYGVPISNKMIIKDISTMTYQDYEIVQFESVNIDTDTIGQFTGFYAYNGNKIFEGDIVKTYSCTWEYMGKGKIEYDTNECLYHIGKYPIQHYVSNTAGDFPEVYIEIIGDIHDNPELLKEEEK